MSKTLFTADQDPEMVARAALAYLNSAMADYLSSRPLAGARELLRRLSAAAGSRFEAAGGTPWLISVNGEAEISLRLTGGYSIRYYNPRIQSEDRYAPALRVAERGELNEYLCWQLLAPEGSSEKAPNSAEAVEGTGPVEVTEPGSIVNDIRSRLESGNKIMVLIDGSPGTGKTSVVAAAITRGVSFCEVVSADRFALPNNEVDVNRLYAHLKILNDQGTEVIVFEGTNLQYYLNKLREINFGEGPYIYDEFGRDTVTVRCQVDDPSRRHSYIRRSSLSDEYYRIRSAVRQLDRFDLVLGYDYVFTRERTQYHSEIKGRTRVRCIGGALVLGASLSSLYGSMVPIYAGLALTMAYVVGIFLDNDHGPAERNDDIAATLRGFIVAMPEAAESSVSESDFLDRLNRLADDMGLPGVIVRGAGGIDVLLRDLHDERIRLHESVRARERAGTQNETALAVPYMFVGWALGFAAGSALLFPTLSFMAFPAAALVSAAGLISGWVIHETGHFIGRKMGRFFEVRAGPAASLLASCVVLMAGVGMTVTGLTPFQHAVIFSLVLGLNYFGHIFADGQILFREKRIRARYALEKILNAGLEGACAVEEDKESLERFYKRVARIYRDTAGLRDLSDKRKLLLDILVLPNLNMIGSEDRRMFSTNVLNGLIKHRHPDVWQPVVELIIEALAKADKVNSQPARETYGIFYGVLSHSVILPGFLEGMVKIYVDAHSEEPDLLHVTRDEFIIQVEKVFRRLARDNPLVGEKMMAGISEYAGSEWVFSIDRERIERSVVRIFRSRLSAEDRILICSRGEGAGVPFKVKHFSETYFGRTLEESVKNGHIEEQDNGYYLTRRGIVRLVKRAKIGMMSYSEIKGFTDSYIPKAAPELGRGMDEGMRDSFRMMRLSADMLAHELMGLTSPLTELTDRIKERDAAGDVLSAERKEVLVLVEKLKVVMNDLDEFRSNLSIPRYGRFTGESSSEGTQRYYSLGQERTAQGVMASVESVREVIEELMRIDLPAVFGLTQAEREHIIGPIRQNLVFAYIKTLGFLRSQGTFDSGGRPENIDINDTLLIAVSGFGDRRGRIELRKREVPKVSADDLLMVEVWTNLIRNALEAMGDKGILRISSEYVRGSGSGNVVVRFADSGPGIADGEITRIFTPYYTTKGPDNAGIGLTISRRIVERAGGSIEVSFPAAGRGSVFSVKLPAVSSSSGESEGSITSKLLRELSLRGTSTATGESAPARGGGTSGTGAGWGLERVEREIVPRLAHAMTTAGYGRKFVIAVDSGDFGKEGVSRVVSAIKGLARRGDRLGMFLRDVIVKEGEAEDLSRSLAALADRGLSKDNMVIITTKDRLHVFSAFKDVSAITAVDDKKLPEGYYYPMLEVVLFSLARALKYERDVLLECYRNMPNAADLTDKQVWGLCWDETTRSYRATVVIELVPGAVKVTGSGDIYGDIARIITTAA